MTASEMVRSALIETKTKHTELAKLMGWSRSNLSFRLKNNSLTWDELARALGFLGYTATVQNGKGEPLRHYGNGTGPKLVRIVEGQTYDTSKASMVGSTKKSDGQQQFAELFVDADNRYFIAYYELWDGGDNRISTLSKDAATEILQDWREGV